MSSALAIDPPSRIATTDRPRSDWRVRVVGLDAAEHDWRALEAEGLATPYQRFDWVKAYAAHVLAAEGTRLALVQVQGADSELVAIMPFEIRRSAGLTTAAFVGGKHANFHMPVFDREFAARLDADGARALLAQAATAIGGIDAFLLRCQPVTWDGLANPIALLDSRPSPSQAYKLTLSSDCEATLQASMSSHARKKHKNKRARFAELGPSRMLLADSDVDKERTLAAFFRQKGQRFADQGIADPFASPAVRGFIRSASGLDGGTASLRIAGLELNGALVATYVGAVHQRRFSGMATSFEPDPTITKVSPGEILLIELIKHECRAGMGVFDLGVGEARYKTTICNQTEDLVDSFVAISARGRLAAGLARLAQRLKSWIKRSPVASRALARLRAARARLTPQPADETTS
jgi:CelD/BcsL family acetyltransferase involved in cellulose biosynthesis